MKCSNCTEPALYSIKLPIASPVHYCERHLPDTWKDQAAQGLFPVDEPVTSSKKRSSVAATIEKVAEILEPADEPVDEPAE